MRDYDPTTGRYIQADPLGLVDGASVYGYAGQNPGRHTDPTGLVIAGTSNDPSCTSILGKVVYCKPFQPKPNYCPVDPEALFPPLPQIVNSEGEETPYGGVEGVSPDPTDPVIGKEGKDQGRKEGGLKGAEKDFDDLIQGPPTSHGGGTKSGKDKNGNTITLYPESSGGSGQHGAGPPTIEGPDYKIRYD